MYGFVSAPQASGALWSGRPLPEASCHGLNVFVPPAGEIHDHQVFAPELGRLAYSFGDSVSAFESWNDALGATQQMKCL